MTKQEWITGILTEIGFNINAERGRGSCVRARRVKDYIKSMGELFDSNGQGRHRWRIHPGVTMESPHQDDIFTFLSQTEVLGDLSGELVWISAAGLL